LDRGSTPRTSTNNIITFQAKANHVGRVWIESDGEWHFRQVHKGHNFEATKFRDLTEEQEAVKRGVLLIRVNNQTTTIEEQVTFFSRQFMDGTTQEKL
jgi:hypothetical protein